MLIGQQEVDHHRLFFLNRDHRVAGPAQLERGPKAPRLIAPGGMLRKPPVEKPRIPTCHQSTASALTVRQAGKTPQVVRIELTGLPGKGIAAGDGEILRVRHELRHSAGDRQ